MTTKAAQPDEVLDAVRDLAPALGERAADAESARRIPEASIKELEDTGFFQLLQPRNFGGAAADPLRFFRCVREIARACGSTGWVASVVGVHPYHVALYDPRAQQEVWGADPRTRVSSSYAPTGTAVPAEEGGEPGFRLSGRWHFSSGCDHADWALLGCLVPDAQGNPADMRTFLVPHRDYRIDEVWDTVGLRGTGSNDVVVEDVFVPDYRALSFGPVGELRAPGLAEHPDPLYRLPFASLFTTTISTPIVGIAEGALAAYTEATGKRFRVSYGQQVAQDPFAQVRIARAASDIDASWRQLSGNIEEMYALAQAGEELSTALRTRVRRDQVIATERAVGALDLLMENAGGSAMRTGPNPVQRAWRDAHTGRGHAANDPERALVLYGQAALGIDVHDTMI